MTAHALDQLQRDAVTQLGDRSMELTLTATLFAFAILRGWAPEGLTMEQLKHLAHRFLESNGAEMPYRYWNGEQISNPCEEAKEVRQ